MQLHRVELTTTRLARGGWQTSQHESWRMGCVFAGLDHMATLTRQRTAPGSTSAKRRIASTRSSALLGSTHVPVAHDVVRDGEALRLDDRR